jgi:hypothetical protein
MKLLCILAFALSGCVYNGPRVDLNVGFMGANVGIAIGGQPPQPVVVSLPPPKGLAK